MTMNPASSGMPPSNEPLAQARVSPSRNSMAVARMPLPITRRIASQPDGTSRWKAATGSTTSGAGISRSHAAVTMPSVPSEPISRLFRS